MNYKLRIILVAALAVFVFSGCVTDKIRARICAECVVKNSDSVSSKTTTTYDQKDSSIDLAAYSSLLYLYLECQDGKVVETKEEVTDSKKSHVTAEIDTTYKGWITNPNQLNPNLTGASHLSGGGTRVKVDCVCDSQRIALRWNEAHTTTVTNDKSDYTRTVEVPMKLSSADTTKLYIGGIVLWALGIASAIAIGYGFFKLYAKFKV